MVTQPRVLLYPLLKVHSSPNVFSALLHLDQALSSPSFVTPQCVCALWTESMLLHLPPWVLQAILSTLTQSSGFILDQQSSRPMFTYSKPNSKAEFNVGCCCSTSLLLNHIVCETFSCSLAQGLKFSCGYGPHALSEHKTKGNAKLIFYHVILFNQLHYSDKCLLGDLPLTLLFL